jgi:uncharacterized protein YgbK (DUF1537 family)
MNRLEGLLEEANPNHEKIDELWHAACAESADTIVVLDDDPTGTQTVHDVPVYTSWDAPTVEEAFEAGDREFFILTNSRSFSAQKTEQVHREIAENIADAAKKSRKSFTLISRGDSTLRGHYPLEDEVLRATLVEKLGIDFDGEVICPAFFEGGRYTCDDIHYMYRDGAFIPVGESEFAKDATFGYRSSNLIDYVKEKSNGACTEADCISISLDELRSFDLDGITAKLESCTGFKKIIVNAMNYDDLKTFTICFLRARAHGKSFICRTAASFPKCLAGIDDIDLLGRNDIEDVNSSNGGLVVIGSHVQLSTQQLEHLCDAGLPLAFCEFDVSEADADGSYKSETARVADYVSVKIEAGTTAVVYTTRKDLSVVEADSERRLAMSVNISDGLTAVVSLLKVRPRYLIAKGGITSSDIATKRLGIRRAEVLGQAAKGIPVWKCGSESRFPGMSYLIFPGNVGTPDTLKSIVEELER